MNLFEKIISKEEKISVVGLGYVGIPLAVAFAEKAQVIGFDIGREKIEQYKNGIDPTDEVGSLKIKSTTVEFTCDDKKIKESKFIIIAVPTPIHNDKTPDLNSVIKASITVGRNMQEGSIVVYESTVYPGVTEDVCIPILEKESGLICGKDFKVGYSPERINPGDKVHRLNNITKIVSGIDEEALNIIADVYELVVEAGVFKAKSIKVAEAAKIVENSQRDINIAFMNELAMIFDRMNINTKEVIEAMNTKWNALNFRPGLVGGHCIGIDPYYFVYEAEKLGYTSQIISAGRKVNDDMGEYVADTVIKQLVKSGKRVKQAKVYIMGITFKENCPDIRNSKVVDIIKALKEYDIETIICDPIADQKETMTEYQQQLVPLESVKDADCIVFAVAHRAFTELGYDDIDRMFRPMNNDEKVIIDVKGIFDKDESERRGYRYWNL